MESMVPGSRSMHEERIFTTGFIIIDVETLKLKIRITANSYYTPYEIFKPLKFVKLSQTILGKTLPERKVYSQNHNKKKEPSQFRKRVIFGLGIRIFAGGVVLAGDWASTLTFAAVCLCWCT